MNIDTKAIFKSPIFWGVAFSFLGVGGYLGGLKPVFAYELAQTNKKLDTFACLQIVIEYEKARAAGNSTMVAYWAHQAGEFNCTLPPS